MEASSEQARPFGLLASWKVVDRASRDQVLSRADIAVLFGIANAINSETGKTWGNLETIARHAAVSRRQALRSVTRLEARGHISVETGRGGKANTYRLRDNPVTERRDNLVPERRDEPVPEQGERRDNLVTGPGTELSPSAGTALSPLSASLLSASVVSTSEQELPLALLTPEDRFDEFWKAYPRSVAKAKAREAWSSKHLASEADKILADVRARVADAGQWTEERYIPHPTTYLNQRRWEDKWKPSAPTAVATSFADVVYVGTADEDLPDYMREKAA